MDQIEKQWLSLHIASELQEQAEQTLRRVPTLRGNKASLRLYQEFRDRQNRHYERLLEKRHKDEEALKALQICFKAKEKPPSLNQTPFSFYSVELGESELPSKRISCLDMEDASQFKTARRKQSPVKSVIARVRHRVQRVERLREEIEEMERAEEAAILAYQKELELLQFSYSSEECENVDEAADTDEFETEANLIKQPHKRKTVANLSSLSSPVQDPLNLSKITEECKESTNQQPSQDDFKSKRVDTCDSISKVLLQSKMPYYPPSSIKSNETLQSLGINFRVLPTLPNNVDSSIITDSEVCGTLYSNDSRVAKKMFKRGGGASTPDFSTPGQPEANFPFQD